MVEAAYHSTGHLLDHSNPTLSKKEENGSSAEAWGPAYEPGDRVRVSVRARWPDGDAKGKGKARATGKGKANGKGAEEGKGTGKGGAPLAVCFSVNGKACGEVSAPSLGANGLSLAVQPYMGGVAELL